jgi:hypothetical protein
MLFEAKVNLFFVASGFKELVDNKDETGQGQASQREQRIQSGRSQTFLAPNHRLVARGHQLSRRCEIDPCRRPISGPLKEVDFLRQVGWFG